MAESGIHYLAVGHVARDLTPEGPRLGGTVAFAARTALAFDYNAGIVTACASDLDLGALDGIALACARSDASTTFENIYSPAGRTQFLRGQAAPLTAASIPLHWLRAPVVHLAPLASELPAEVAEALAAALAGSFVGLTPQGWMRRWDAAGRVTNTPDAWTDADALLRHSRAVVASRDDIGGDWAVAEQWAKAAPVLVITESADGCTVFVRGHGARHFRAPQVVEVDPTGAGDVFAAAFFINLYETDDPWGSARLANEVAALSVTRVGLDSTPAAVEIGYCRARAALAAR